MLAQLFLGFTGKMYAAETSVQRGEKARFWRTELSNTRDMSLQALVQRRKSIMVRGGGSHPASPPPLNLFGIHAGVLGNSQL